MRHADELEAILLQMEQSLTTLALLAQALRRLMEQAREEERRPDFDWRSGQRI